jgi:hypothetical protein
MSLREGARQLDREGAPCAHLTFQKNIDMMLLDDVIGNAKPQSGSSPLFLGSKERLEDVSSNFIRNSSVVLWTEPSFKINPSFAMDAELICSKFI